MVFPFDTIQGGTSEFLGVPLIALCETPFHGTRGVSKRLTDLVLAGADPDAGGALHGGHRPADPPDLAGARDFQTAPLRPRRPGNHGLQVPHHDGDGGRRCHQTGHAERLAHHAARAAAAPHFNRRAAAVVECTAGSDEPRGTAAACGRSQRAVSQVDQGLHDPPQGGAWNDRARAGAWHARGDPDAGADGAAHQVRPGLSAQLVAAVGSEDPSSRRY